MGEYGAVAIHREMSLNHCPVIPSIRVANDSKNTYFGPENMEQLLVNKLTENNISLDFKEEIAINIDAEGNVKLSNFTIKDESKFNDVTRMFETDKDLQKEFANICTSLQTSQ
ncbi:MAG: hypothetical protein LBC74_06480 [Planctomycetaceae bacterium]|nr:hypothetical protein [Planctomycetaceae bacterium]